MIAGGAPARVGDDMAEGPMSVGGQAILEGVMMRSPHSLAIAVRRPTGEIVVKEDAWHSIWDKARWLRKPLLRGAVVLFESMHNGIKALTFSANEAAKFAEEGEGGAAPKPGEDASSLAIVGTIVASVAFGFGLFAALPHFLTWLTGIILGNASLASGKDLSFQIVDGVIKIAFLIGYLALISRLKDIQRVFQYHGAEHKSIFCYEAGRPLTVENARGYTTLHPRCGTSFLLITFVVSILLFSCFFPLLHYIVPHTPALDAVRSVLAQKPWLRQLLFVFIKLPLMFPVAGIAYEMTRLSARYPTNPIVRAFTWPGLQLQHITTREPDDEQLEVALCALHKTLWREAELQRGRPAHKATSEDGEVFGSYGDFVAQLGDAALKPAPIAG